MAANDSRMRGDMNEGSATPTNQSYANPEKERSSETHGCENASQGVSIGFCSPYWRHAGTLEGLLPAVNHGHARSRDKSNAFCGDGLASGALVSDAHTRAAGPDHLAWPTTSDHARRRIGGRRRAVCRVL